MAHRGELPIPDFFDAASLERVSRVPYQERARQAVEWAGRHAIEPAAGDRRRVGLLCVDVQNTFCLPEFELFVGGRSGRGAIDDSIRLCRFLYRNLSHITEIIATLDTHTAIQIFHSLFWVDENGGPVPPFTEIRREDVERGRRRANPAVARSLGMEAEDLDRHALHYVRTLADRYPLMIWPYHSMLGGIGHALVTGVEEAIFFHSVARASQPVIEVKGQIPLTENYSVLRPEVLETHDGRPIGRKNTGLIERLLAFDVLMVAGQAKSHCVAWTLSDLLREIEARDPALAGKVYLLEDCTSPVVAPGADFSDAADEAFRRFAASGMHLVRSTEAMEGWPGAPISRSML